MLFRPARLVAAHPSEGHLIFLPHRARDADGQTMKQGTPSGTTWRRDLGEGDARGNNLKD